MAFSQDDSARVVLKYGKGEVTLDLSGAANVTYLHENDMPEIPDLDEAFQNAVEAGAIGQPLASRVHAGDLITIVVSDLTRFWMRQDLVCELLVRYLQKLGVAYGDIKVLVALGTHRPMSAAELEKLASVYVYSRVEVINHNCDAPDLVKIGTTTVGNDVYINPLAVGRKVIVISGTVHHLMSGYGGGRKSILPGICSRATIFRNHLNALDPQAPRSSGLVGSGRLSYNPINSDMLEAAAMAAPVFGISIVANSRMRQSALFAGDFDRAWQESCRFCQQAYGRKIDSESDVVIASCGGYPKDVNLYQAVKALLNGICALKEGGTFVFLAECQEGGGAADFFDWITPLNKGTLDADLRAGFTIAGYIFYASCEAVRRAARFEMLSGFDPEMLRGMGINTHKTVSGLQDALDLRGKTVCVIPYGGSVLPQNAETFARLGAEVASGEQTKGR